MLAGECYAVMITKGRLAAILLLFPWIVPTLWFGLFYSDAWQRCFYWLFCVIVLWTIFHFLDVPDPASRVLYRGTSEVSSQDDCE